MGSWDPFCRDDCRRVLGMGNERELRDLIGALHENLLEKFNGGNNFNGSVKYKILLVSS
jgi:hypothetical protein